MLTGRSPWRAAISSEGCYAGFMHDPNYLRSMLPLSRRATFLIASILKLNPLSRLAIKDIRDEVMNIDTFFMREQEVQRASAHVQEIVARTLPKARLNNPPPASRQPSPDVPVGAADAPSARTYAPPRPSTSVTTTDASPPRAYIPPRPPTPKFVRPPTPGPIGSHPPMGPEVDSDDEHVDDGPDPESPLVYLAPTRRAAPTRAPLPNSGSGLGPSSGSGFASGSGSSSDDMQPPSLFNGYSDSDSSNDAIPVTPSMRPADLRAPMIVDDFALPDAASMFSKGRPSSAMIVSPGNVPAQPIKHSSRSFRPREFMRSVMHKLRVDKE